LSGPAGFARTVAIKRLRDEYTDDPEFVSMFLDEARLAARIHHPNVVPTLEVVQSEEGTFLVMEYVHGESLAKLLSAMRSNKASDVRLVGSVMSGVLRGLHAAHEATDGQGQPLGIVHRDVSPHNVLVGVDGIPRVIDFGVAKALARLQTVRKGQVKGKITYMAPERVQNQAATRQSDVYAAAVVTWEFLTGQRLFPNNQAAIRTAVLQEPIKAPSEVAGHVPITLDHVVLRGLERDPAQRYQTALEMALELERCAGVAPASEIGGWVESLASDELARRASLLAEVESLASGTRPTLTTGSAPASARVAEMRSNPSSVPAIVHPPMPPNRRKHVTLLAALGGALVLLLGIAMVLSRACHRGDARAEATAPAPSDTPSAAASLALPFSPAQADSAPPSGPSGSTAASSPAPSSPRRSTPARQTPSRCDPPFVIDDHDHKIYKPGCL
jgi:serine/threonine protein kinase